LNGKTVTNLRKSRNAKAKRAFDYANLTEERGRVPHVDPV